MIEVSPSGPQPSFIGILHKLSNYLVGATILCYLSGFVITNLYLGSLGIVNLDLLRARYVLAGVLFLAFIAAIIYLVYGLLRTLRKNRHKQPRTIVLRATWYSLLNIGLIYFVVATMSVLAGSPATPPIGTPKLSPALPWSAWLAAAPLDKLREAAIHYGIAIAAVVLTISLVVIINPKDKHGIRTPRRRFLADAVAATKQHTGRLIAIFMGLFIFLYAWYLAMSLINFMATNTVTTKTTTISSLLQGGWLRYFGAIAGIYAPVGIFLTIPFIFPKNTTERREDDDTVESSPWIYLIALAITILVPAYSLGIYPNLPQQLGGGRVIQIAITTDSDNLMPFFDSQENDIYLIDRTSASLLLLLINKNQREDRVIEVSSSLVQSITYSVSP